MPPAFRLPVVTPASPRQHRGVDSARSVAARREPGQRELRVRPPQTGRLAGTGAGRRQARRRHHRRRIRAAVLHGGRGRPARVDGPGSPRHAADPARRRRAPAAHCLRQRRHAAAGAIRRPRSRDGDPRRARRVATAARAALLRRGRARLGRRRRRRRRSERDLRSANPGRRVRIRPPWRRDRDRLEGARLQRGSGGRHRRARRPGPALAGDPHGSERGALRGRARVSRRACATAVEGVRRRGNRPRLYASHHVGHSRRSHAQSRTPVVGLRPRRPRHVQPHLAERRRHIGGTCRETARGAGAVDGRAAADARRDRRRVREPAASRSLLRRHPHLRRGPAARRSRTARVPRRGHTGLLFDDADPASRRPAAERVRQPATRCAGRRDQRSRRARVLARTRSDRRLGAPQHTRQRPLRGRRRRRRRAQQRLLHAGSARDLCAGRRAGGEPDERCGPLGPAGRSTDRRRPPHRPAGRSDTGDGRREDDPRHRPQHPAARASQLARHDVLRPGGAADGDARHLRRALVLRPAADRGAGHADGARRCQPRSRGARPGRRPEAVAGGRGGGVDRARRRRLAARAVPRGRQLRMAAVRGVHGRGRPRRNGGLVGAGMAHYAAVTDGRHSRAAAIGLAVGASADAARRSRHAPGGRRRRQRIGHLGGRHADGLRRRRPRRRLLPRRPARRAGQRV